MGPTAFTMQMDGEHFQCARFIWIRANTHICAQRESIQLKISLKSSVTPRSFHPQPSRTQELDPYALIHTSTAVIHLSVYSFIHLSISSDCQASSPAQSLPIDPFYLASTSLIQVGADKLHHCKDRPFTGLGLDNIPFKIKFVNLYKFFMKLQFLLWTMFFC